MTDNYLSRSIAAFLIIFLFLLLVNQAFAATKPFGAGIIYQTTLEGWSGGSGIATSTNITMSQIIGGINTLGIISSKSFGLKLGLGDTLFGSLGLMLLGISPDAGNNVSNIHIDAISGANFTQGIQVKLTYTGENTINGENIVVVSSSKISCDFNLTGAKPGRWTLIATKEGDAGNTLPNAFLIKSIQIAPAVVINSPNPFDPASGQTTIYYNLPKDSDVEVYIFSISGNLLWKTSFLAGSDGGRPGENKLIWDGISSFGDMLSTGVYFVHIMEKGTGKTMAKGKISVIRR